MADYGNYTNTTSCDEEANPEIRLLMFSVGMLIALVGCLCNLFLFTALLGVRVYLYQCFLAFLDFTMCALFVHLFGLLRISQVFEIKWLYDAIISTYAISCIVSRHVQVAIPYVLIAVSAERFGQISGRNNYHARSYNRFHICLTIVGLTFLLRGPLLFAITVKELEDCDKYFYSKALSATPFGESDGFYYIDLVQQFMNLFVTFIVLCVLNFLIVEKLKKSHRRARRQSASVSHTLELTCKILHIPINFFTKFPKSHSMRRLDDEARREQKRVRFAIRTTVVIISSYLACNSINFLLYCVERFWSSLMFRCGNNLVVLASAIRIFIYYKYNPEIRKQIRKTIPFYSYFFMEKVRQKSGRCQGNSIIVVNGSSSAENIPLQNIQFIDS